MLIFDVVLIFVFIFDVVLILVLIFDVVLIVVFIFDVLLILVLICDVVLILVLILDVVLIIVLIFDLCFRSTAGSGCVCLAVALTFQQPFARIENYTFNYSCSESGLCPFLPLPESLLCLL